MIYQFSWYYVDPTSSGFQLSSASEALAETDGWESGVRVLILVPSHWEAWVGSLYRRPIFFRWISPTQALSTGSSDWSLCRSLGLWAGEEGISGSPVLLAAPGIGPSLIGFPKPHPHLCS